MKYLNESVEIVQVTCVYMWCNNICTSADIICNVVRTFLALGFPPYLTYSKEGKQTNNYWNRKNPQKVHLLLAYLLSNVFNECLLFLALLVFQPESFILYEIKITNLSSQKKSSTFWEDDQSIKYLDYLFLLFLFGFFRRLIRGLLLRRHDGGQADFPANCARSVHITQSSLQSSGRKWRENYGFVPRTSRLWTLKYHGGYKARRKARDLPKIN